MPGGEGVPFRVELDTQAKNYPAFQGDPIVSLSLEKIDEKGNLQAVPVPPLTRSVGDAKLIFAAHHGGLEPASYVGHYAIKGRLTTGEDVSLRSEDFMFVVGAWVWWYVIGAGGRRAVGVVCHMDDFLEDRPIQSGPRGDTERHLARESAERGRSFSGATAAKALKWGRGGKCLEFGPGRAAMPELEKMAFRIEARREGKHKRLRVRVLNGLVTVEGHRRMHRLRTIYHRDEITFQRRRPGTIACGLMRLNIKRNQRGKKEVAMPGERAGTEKRPLIRRTAIIGLGGTGVSTILHIKKILHQYYRQIPLSVSFLALDTTQNQEKSLRFRLDGKRHTVKLEPHEFFYLSVDNPAGSDPGLPSISEWWPEQLPTQAITKGAGGIRAVGRLAFCAHAAEIMEWMEKARAFAQRSGPRPQDARGAGAWTWWTARTSRCM